MRTGKLQTAGSDAIDKRKVPLPLRESNHHSSVVQALHLVRYPGYLTNITWIFRDFFCQFLREDAGVLPADGNGNHLALEDD